MTQPPGLFGQKYSSRNYANPSVWGKNQFNSSFPASLVAYMYSIGISPVYICTDTTGDICHKEISGDELFRINPLSDNAFYNFEAGFSPYEQYYSGTRENIDLVMVDRETGNPLSGLEVKLTALPDETTKKGPSEKFSCEIVVRPPTICFLACSICKHYDSESGRMRLKSLLDSVPQINHWEEISEVTAHYDKIQDSVVRVSLDMQPFQTPLIIQPIWKSDSKNSRLSEDCLDVFVWSNLATIQMCISENFNPSRGINRFQRTIIWIYRMLFDFCVYGQFDYTRIIKHLSYNTANDKAFSLSGRKSFPILNSPELQCPRIKKCEIKNIILGGGQEFLSPERRFDAVIVNTPGLFD